MILAPLFVPTRVILAQRILALALLAVATQTCNPQVGQDPPDGDIADTVLPVCPQGATLYGIGHDEMPVDLPTGSLLPIIEGFQGFLFVRLGLRAPYSLPSTVKLKVRVAVESGTTVASQFATVHSRALGNNHFETNDVPFFFHDMPLGALVGRTARVQITTQTGTCVVHASADVTLTVGTFMAADAGFWNASDTSP